LADADYTDIDAVARRHERGVLAVGNFALAVVLMQKFAEMAAKWIPPWEIIDHAHDDKVVPNEESVLPAAVDVTADRGYASRP
jgi:4-hydroxy-tetrahydrodipicolinate reductase